MTWKLQFVPSKGIRWVNNNGEVRLRHPQTKVLAATQAVTDDILYQAGGGDTKLSELYTIQERFTRRDSAYNRGGRQGQPADLTPEELMTFKQRVINQGRKNLRNVKEDVFIPGYTQLRFNDNKGYVGDQYVGEFKNGEFVYDFPVTERAPDAEDAMDGGGSLPLDSEISYTSTLEDQQIKDQKPREIPLNFDYDMRNKTPGYYEYNKFRTR